MAERIHDDEPDTGMAVVRALLHAECPQWADAPLEYLATSGTSNAMWRVRLDGQPDVVIRLPRRPGAAEGVGHEAAALQQVEAAFVGTNLETPRLRHVGSANDVFPYEWLALEWIDGDDAWSNRHQLDAGSLDGLAADLARAVAAIGKLAFQTVQPRRPTERGGPLGPLLDQLDVWLSDPEWNAAALIDLPRVKRMADQAREVIDEGVIDGFVHGDLIPGNLLVHRERLAAIIDWGGAGRGDTAQDLAPAWSILAGASRAAFKELVGATEAAWIRGRAFELEHAVGGVLYYAPKNHMLGDLMARTLDRILAEETAG